MACSSCPALVPVTELLNQKSQRQTGNEQCACEEDYSAEVAVEPTFIKPKAETVYAVLVPGL